MQFSKVFKVYADGPTAVFVAGKFDGSFFAAVAAGGLFAAGLAALIIVLLKKKRK